jgi:surfeit locus 1 family protein
MKRRIALVTAAMLAALAVLLGLAFWQLQRKAWKEALIARLEAQARRPPVPLDIARLRGEPPAAWEFSLAEVSGRFLHASEFHVWTPQRQGSAWTVFTPFELADTGGQRYPTILMVARGIVPDAVKSAAARRSGQVEGRVTIVGRLRAGETPGAFAAEPDLAKNEWHARDIRAMRKVVAEALVASSASGSAAEAAGAIPDAYLEIQAEPPPGGWPRPMLSPINLRNDHLGYALTWLGVAATLLGVYAAFIWREIRQS